MPHLLLLPHMPLLLHMPLQHQPLLHINLHQQPIPPVHINHHIPPVPINQATSQPHMAPLLLHMPLHHQPLLHINLHQPILVLHPYLVMVPQLLQTLATTILYQKILWNCLNQTKVDSDLVELKLASNLLADHLSVEDPNPEDPK